MTNSASEHCAEQLLIIGPGGVGKSALGRLMTGALPSFTEEETKYRESLQIEEHRLSQPVAEVVILPGQQSRRHWFWTDYEREIAAGKIQGVMLVTSYGYHSIGDVPWRILAPKDSELETFLPRYLAKCRKDEIEIATRIANSIKLSPKPVWLLTVVTKEDLWHDLFGEVDKHYREGAYGKAIARALDGSQVLHRTEQVLTCLVCQNFSTGRNELLAKTVAGYDWPKMAESWSRLWRTLATLRDQEKD